MRYIKYYCSEVNNLNNHTSTMGFICIYLKSKSNYKKNSLIQNDIVNKNIML